MAFELEKKLYDSLKEFIGIKHRLAGCLDKTCLVCTENAKILEGARKAVQEFDDKYGIDDIPF